LGIVHFGSSRSILGHSICLTSFAQAQVSKHGDAHALSSRPHTEAAVA
jgi:hypothetical protein